MLASTFITGARGAIVCHVQERSQPRHSTKTHYLLGTRRCCDVESMSVTLIQRRSNVVCQVGYSITWHLLFQHAPRRWWWWWLLHTQRSGCSSRWILSGMSEFYFTSLSAQSWQYRDRRKSEFGTMPYPYRTTSGVLYGAQCIDSTAHSIPLNSLEHCICTTPMTNIRPDRASSSVTSEFPATTGRDRMSHRGRHPM